MTKSLETPIKQGKVKNSSFTSFTSFTSFSHFRISFASSEVIPVVSYRCLEGIVLESIEYG